MYNWLNIGIGLFLLLGGGEVLIRGAINLANRMQWSALFTSIIIVGVGTSLPELMVSVQSAMRGKADISIGNVVGSNIANILLILGVVAMIQPIKCQRSLLHQEGAFVMVSAMLLLAAGAFGWINIFMGAAMVLLLGMFIAYTLWYDRKSLRLAHVSSPTSPHELGLLSIAIYVAVGLAGLILGADQIVTSALNIAHTYNIAEGIIGLTIVAIGTSLPELSIGIVAALKKKNDINLGNVLGSNIFNSLGVLGTTAIITPLTIAPHMIYDIWIMAGVTTVLMLFLSTGWRLSRLEGLLFIISYCCYTYWLYVSGVK